MIVVDANVIAYFLIEGDKTALAQKAWQIDNHWLAAALWRDELLNVLTTYFRTSGLSSADAIATWRRAHDFIETAEPGVDFEQALLVAVESGISAHDAQYITLSIVKDVPLLSEDRRLQNKYPQKVLSLESFCQG